MADSVELCYLSIADASALMRDGELSPVELTRAFLQRIEELDPKLQAYITVLPESAMREARRAEALDAFMEAALSVRGAGDSPNVPASEA